MFVCFRRTGLVIGWPARHVKIIVYPIVREIPVILSIRVLTKPLSPSHHSGSWIFLYSPSTTPFDSYHLFERHFGFFLSRADLACYWGCPIVLAFAMEKGNEETRPLSAQSCRNCILL